MWVGGHTRGCLELQGSWGKVAFDRFQGLSCRCLRGEQYTSRSFALQPFFDDFLEKSQIVGVGPIARAGGQVQQDLPATLPDTPSSCS